MLSLLAALVFAAPLAQHELPAAPAWSARIFATIARSEWCPAGNVHLSLASGEYSFTAPATRPVCQNSKLERRIRSGRLQAAPLEEVRQEYRRAQAEGLNICRAGSPPPQVVVSNGGNPVLVITSGARTEAAPDDQGCWSEAARDLLGAIEISFESIHEQSRAED